MLQRIAKFILAEDIEEFKNEIRDLRDENEALREEKADLTAKNASLAFDQEEYKFLKQLYELNGDPSADEAGQASHGTRLNAGPAGRDDGVKRRDYLGDRIRAGEECESLNISANRRRSGRGLEGIGRINPKNQK